MAPLSSDTASYLSTEESSRVTLNIPNQVVADWRRVYQVHPAIPGSYYRLDVETLGEGITGGMGMVAAIHFHDADDKMLVGDSAFSAPVDGTWLPLLCRAKAPEGAVSLRVNLFLHGQGKATFRNCSLSTFTLPEDDPDPIITLTPGRSTGTLIGFGAEDDGWFYNQHNRDNGVTEEHCHVREERLRWLDVDWVRMFFWYRDFHPAMDAQTFTWDTDNMQSHYRTLDLYQSMGTRVTVCGVEWGVKDIWQQDDIVVTANVALLEYLIKERGYTCIKDWTLTNEPNLAMTRAGGGTFQQHTDIQRRVKTELAARGLHINVMGSDDGDGLSWFQQTVANDAAYQATDIFASHKYFSEHARDYLGLLLQDRVALLRAKPAEKPFVLAEFGFRDPRFTPPAINPFMEDFDYALLTARACIEGLNVGAVGFNIWCMSEVYYPGGRRPMGSGLWNFVDRDMSVRPVYHAMAQFMRHTEAGDTITPYTSSAPNTLQAAGVGDCLFWVHKEKTARMMEVEGFTEGMVYTEDAVTTDRECGVSMIIEEGNQVMLPPRSFGFLRKR